MDDNMRVDEFLVDYLISKGVTDVFGIPGGVILDFLYAMDARKEELTPHLCFNEQGAAYAALGYAQTKQALGVAYATRGPGITNMVTTIADAYYDSSPLMIITAHGVQTQNTDMRIEYDQELDVSRMFSDITKYTVRIDSVEQFEEELHQAYMCAVSGRKGPVVVDILSSLFSKEINVALKKIEEQEECDDFTQAITVVEKILSELSDAKKPVILIGDGIKQAGMAEVSYDLLQKLNIPVISSRAAHDIVADLPCYYGFVGSHGTRYANFILAKADVLITLGNRMSFPVHSESFRSIFDEKKTIRIDIDSAEFMRDIPNSICFQADIKSVLLELERADISCLAFEQWNKFCVEVYRYLWDVDQKQHIKSLMQLLERDTYSTVVSCDVGNHEFWISHAAVYAKIKKNFLYSKSFGGLGCSIPKAIGAYYASKHPVLCVTGDQGMQMNIQELQYISMHRIPINIVVINNHASGMIRSRELDRGKKYLLHTTKESGYGVPNLEKLASTYGLTYFKANNNTFNSVTEFPCLTEFHVDDSIGLDPSLPRGNQCWDMVPELCLKKREKLKNIINYSVCDI